MCKHCDGIQGEPMICDGGFTVRLMPIDGSLRIDHACDWYCEHSYDSCSLPVDYCPMCGRDLRGGDR